MRHHTPATGSDISEARPQGRALFRGPFGWTLREPSRPRLWVEFLLLYVGAPVVLWWLQPRLTEGNAALFALIGLTMVAGMALLALTPGWRWRELLEVRGTRWGLVAALCALFAVVIFPLAYWAVGERFLGLARAQPALLAMIWALYPWFSVLGQEVVYRPLFFRRYAPILPPGLGAILLNAALFAAAHLFYRRWETVALTFAGGLVFAWYWQRTRSFPGVFVLHWVAGGLLFTSGLGWYFYTGAIGR